MVMIADDDGHGVFRRLAIGTVYPEIWIKTQPEWRVLGWFGLLSLRNTSIRVEFLSGIV